MLDSLLCSLFLICSRHKGPKMPNLLIKCNVFFESPLRYVEKYKGRHRYTRRRKRQDRADKKEEEHNQNW